VPLDVLTDFEEGVPDAAEDVTLEELERLAAACCAVLDDVVTPDAYQEARRKERKRKPARSGGWVSILALMSGPAAWRKATRLTYGSSRNKCLIWRLGAPRSGHQCRAMSSAGLRRLQAPLRGAADRPATYRGRAEPSI